jgi:hypothetical protein
MTMPPTTSAMAGTAMATIKIEPKIRSRSPVIASGVMIAKLSLSLAEGVVACALIVLFLQLHH